MREIERMFSEDDLLPISGLQHVMFCERQFALIHIEQIWVENRFTAEGRILHERVDIEGHESRRLFKQEYAMAIRSLQYGLIGKTDLVEIYLNPNGSIAEVIPVEFKRGKDKENDCDRVQLYAQALCLEEMLNVPIPRGSFYYLGSHRRTAVEFSSDIRSTTLRAIDTARSLISSGRTPPAEYDRSKCDRCSLIDDCMPKSVGRGEKRVEAYVRSELARNRKECLI